MRPLLYVLVNPYRTDSAIYQPASIVEAWQIVRRITERSPRSHVLLLASYERADIALYDSSI